MPFSWRAWGLVVVLALSLLLAACGDRPGLDPAQVERGRVLYEANCRVCHGDAATGVGGIPGAANHGPEGHTWHHPDGQLLDIILGRFQYEGRVMPSFDGTLSEEEVGAILTYLKSNWLPEHRAFQEEASHQWQVLERRGQ